MKKYTDGPFYKFWTLVLFVGSICMIGFGGACVAGHTREIPSQTVYCGPEGLNGGIAMIVVGLVLICCKMIVICCLCFGLCAGGWGTAMFFMK
jgi:hypothetical protein